MTACCRSLSQAVDGFEPLHMDCVLPPSERVPLDCTYLAMHPMSLSEILAGRAQGAGAGAGAGAAGEGQPERAAAALEPEPEIAAMAHGAHAVNTRTLLRDAVQASLAKVLNPHSSLGVTAVIKFLLRRLLPTGEGGAEAEASTRFCLVLQEMLLVMVRQAERLMDEAGRHWVKVRARDIAFVQKCGSFRSAVYLHLQEKVTSWFAAVLKALSTNDNLALLARSWDSNVPLRTRWMDVAQSPLFAVQREVELNADPAAPYVCRSTGKRGFLAARSAFSWVVFSSLQNMRGKAEQLAGHARTVAECLHEELTQSIYCQQQQRAAAAAAVSRERQELEARAYLSDFVDQAYSVERETSSMADVFECILLKAAHLCSNECAREAVDDDFLPPPLSIAAIHAAAWLLADRLEQLELLLSPASPLGANEDFMLLLHGTLASLDDAAGLPDIDVLVLERVVEELEAQATAGGADSLDAWVAQHDALRSPLESWATICKCSAATPPQHEALADVLLRCDRLRALHLFVRMDLFQGFYLLPFSIIPFIQKYYFPDFEG